MPDILAAITRAAFANGATHVSLHVVPGRPIQRPKPRDPPSAARRRAARCSTPSGRRVVPPDEREPSDVPLVWDGEVVAAVRMPPLHGALDRLIDTVEAELGGRLPELGREDKQRAVRLLDERGAFTCAAPSSRSPTRWASAGSPSTTT